MKVSIEYCGMWNYLPNASSLEGELISRYDNIDVTLIEGSGGIFDVYFNDKLIFSKKILKRFPSKGEIIDLINEK
mgnify:CR=1 FL=1